MTESLQDYFVEETDKLNARILELPEILSDAWSDIEGLTNAEIEVEVTALIFADNPAVGPIIDLLESSISEMSPSAVPRIRDAIDELRGVKSTQDALKALAAIIFIIANDSIFHLLRTMAGQIVVTAALKITTLELLRASVLALGDAAASWEAAGLSSSEVRDQLNAAAGEVLNAKRQVDRMYGSALGGQPQFSPAVTRATGHIDAALDLINPEGFGSSLGGAVAGGAMNALSGGMASALVMGSMVSEAKDNLSKYLAAERKLSGLLSKFKIAVANYSASTMESYQATLLKKVSTRLGTVYASMKHMSTGGATFAVAQQAPGWVANLATAKTMLEQMPPEVRAQQEFDETALAAYNKAVGRLLSMTADNIIAGIDYPSSLGGATKRMASVAEVLLESGQTTEIQDIKDWIAVTSSGAPTLGIGTQLGFVVGDNADGESRLWRMSGGALVEDEAFTFLPGVEAPRPSRIEAGLVHAHLVIEIMTEFNANEPPGQALVTSLIGLLRLLQQDRAADMLSEAGISDFMDAAPLSWTYAGAAVECLQKAMQSAIDEGFDKVYDELDTKLAMFSAKVAALQRGMTRKSVFSLDSVLDRLQANIDELDLVKQQIVGLVTGLDC
jgi:hypothetical protein